jgi:putative heme iron utilization protein
MMKDASTADTRTGRLSSQEVDRVRAALADDPNAMTMQLARRLGVPEAEVVRALPEGRVAELDATRWEELIRAFELLGKLHVIVSNGSTTCEVVGQFGGFSTWGEFFNVQSASLDMHVRHGQLGSVFAVEKPSHVDGARTLSFQFYDRRGDSAFKVFLNFGGKPTPEREAKFRELREKFRGPSGP